MYQSRYHPNCVAAWIAKPDGTRLETIHAKFVELSQITDKYHFVTVLMEARALWMINSLHGVVKFLDDFAQSVGSIKFDNPDDITIDSSVYHERDSFLIG
ncbi:unnamed protein product [Periconia digitata]|uniref:Uncharacterized protein n=1 Tax=Periconia digitata TaxID=1303443 RepID=A0A9W4UA28_9PLEO|nr:unnamed protein product [Periconia digitata]